MRIVYNDTHEVITFKVPATGARPSHGLTPEEIAAVTKVQPGEAEPLPEGYDGPVIVYFPGSASIAVSLVEEDEPSADQERLEELKYARPMGVPLNDPEDTEQPTDGGEEDK